MSLIDSRDILTKLCSNDYYRGDDVQCAIQCLAEGKAIGRVRTLEDVEKTVVDEKLKESLMKSKDGESEFDGVNWKWLLPLLLFPFASTLPRREISATANVNGKSVVITYDPHDPEAAKAVDVWRKALFAEPPKDAKPIAAHVLNMLDIAVKSSNLQTEYYRGFRNALRYAACLIDGKEPQYEGPTWFDSGEPAAEMVKNDEPATPNNIGFFWEADYNGEYILRWRQREGGDADKVIGLSRRLSFLAEKEKFRVKVYHEGHADISGGARDIEAENLEAAMKSAEQTVFTELTEHMRHWQNRLAKWKPVKEPAAMTELEKAAKPLRDYLKTHGDPHTSVIVTQDGATEAQDERRVKFDGGAT